MGLWASMNTYESTTEYIISASINSTNSDVSQWLGHCCLVLFFYFLATIKQKICWKIWTLCAENCEWSDSTWPCCLERAAWANSAALKRLHKVARSSHIDSVCRRCVEISLQRYMQQSHRSATEPRAADTTTSARSLWIAPPNPNDARRFGELNINYKGKHLEAVLYSSKRSFPDKVPILPPVPFTICCIHIQPVHEPCWLPSIPTHSSVFPANGRRFGFFST